jgi:O-antigen ligase
MLFLLSGIVILAGSLFGGATHAGYAGDIAAQLASIPLLAGALWPALSEHDPRRYKARGVFGLFCVIAFIIFIQVLPLPFNLGYGGAPLPSTPQGQEAWAWTTLSRTPQATWAAAVSLIVPLAVFGAVMQLGLSQRLMLCWLLLGLGGLSLFLGFAQVAQGPQSELRFYGVTNPEEAVGLFANRNHFAAHLYVTLALAAMWFQMTAATSLERGRLGTRSTLVFAAAAMLLVAIVAGLAFSRSKAGMMLAAAALAGLVAIALTQGRTHPGGSRIGQRATIAVLGFAAIFTVLFGLGRLLTRFEGDQAQDVRSALSQTTFEAARKALPLGTGLGSFVPVYAAAEKTEDMFEGYANRAHNELAELLLETGLLGGVLLLAFLAWYVRRFRAAWLAGGAARDPLQTMLEKTATLVIALLLAHSLVDYPLRTTALGIVFAFFCAILAAPASVHLSHGEGQVRPKHASRQPGPQPATAAPPREKWESQVDWPDSWQRADE